MSLGFTADIVVPEPAPTFDIMFWSLAITGIPSTTHRGSLPAPIEEIPRIRMVVGAPGCPEYEEICTPAILPASIFSTEATGVSPITSDFTVVTEPVLASRLTVPYATTITSSSISASSSITTLIWALLLIGITASFIPTNVNTSVPLAGALIWYLPSTSVEVP